MNSHRWFLSWGDDSYLTMSFFSLSLSLCLCLSLTHKHTHTYIYFFHFIVIALFAHKLSEIFSKISYISAKRLGEFPVSLTHRLSHHKVQHRSVKLFTNKHYGVSHNVTSCCLFWILHWYVQIFPSLGCSEKAIWRLQNTTLTHLIRGSANVAAMCYDSCCLNVWQLIKCISVQDMKRYWGLRYNNNLGAM